MGPTLRGPVDWFQPVGMRSSAGNQFALRARPRSLAAMRYDDLLAEYFIIAGTPDEVGDRLRMHHRTTMRSIELMGAKVIPALATL